MPRKKKSEAVQADHNGTPLTPTLTAEDIATARFQEFHAMGGAFATAASQGMEALDEEKNMKEALRDVRKTWKRQLRRLERSLATLSKE